MFDQGAGSAADTSQFLAASTASEVYPIFQELYPKHSVSRLDACEDYSGAGTWDKLEALVTEVCSLHKVTMAPFGEGHVRPDGTRDATKGRSWYCGSKNSPFRIVIYEKGLEQIAKGIPDDPTRVRLEVRIRPSSKSKEFVGSSGLMPIDLFGMSRWGLEVAKRLGVAELKRMAIGSVWQSYGVRGSSAEDRQNVRPWNGSTSRAVWVARGSRAHSLRDPAEVQDGETTQEFHAGRNTWRARRSQRQLKPALTTTQLGALRYG